MASAYAVLHDRGVLHGDVHPRNLLVKPGPGSKIKIIDFGCSHWNGLGIEYAQPERPRVSHFSDPESAAEYAAQGTVRAGSNLGEQYSVAALIYFLIAGVHYIDFSLVEDVLARQIIDESPRPLSRAGARGWPDLERVLGRALRKEPQDRYHSMRDFSDALCGVLPLAGVPNSNSHIRPGQRSDSWLGTAQSFDDQLRTIQSAPLCCSVYNGAAGIGYAHYHTAVAHGNAESLVLADTWTTHASLMMGDELALYDARLGITPSRVGTASLFHAQAGIHCVAALIAHARNDPVGLRQSIEQFLEAAAQPGDELDVTFGAASALLGVCMLSELSQFVDPGLRSGLAALGVNLCDRIWGRISESRSRGLEAVFAYSGIAHGWAGVLYATLRWGQLRQGEIPVACHSLLEQLGDLAEPSASGVRWRRKLLEQGRAWRWGDYSASWCNGTAGQVFLWLIADRVLGPEVFKGLAEQAGLHAWKDAEDVGNLCCGLVGRAYSMLALYRHTGEQAWLGRARQLADRAAHSRDVAEGSALGLFKGRLGLALLRSDLEQPQTARFPFFEDHGWERRTSGGLAFDAV